MNKEIIEQKHTKREFELDIEFEIDENNRVDMNQVIELMIAYNKLFRTYEHLKDNWNKLKEIIKQKQDYYRYRKDNRYRTFLSELLDKIQEIEGSDNK